VGVVELRDVRIAGIAMITAGAAIAGTGVHPTLVCPLRALTGVPCPLCGMTTSVEATLQGDPGAALAANPAGLVAVAAALLALFVRLPRIVVPRAVLTGVLGMMWVFELHRYGVL
jgi:hypothetical protein